MRMKGVGSECKHVKNATSHCLYNGESTKGKGEKRNHVNRACDTQRLDTIRGEEHNLLRINVKKGGLKNIQRSENQIETSCAPAFWIECVQEVGVGTLFAVCLGTIHAPVTATYVSYILIFVPSIQIVPLCTL